MGPESRPSLFRFGPFELDTREGELRKHGVRLSLQDQPLKILIALLERPGEIVTREVLVRTVWPEGVFVDFERGLNAAVNRLRQTLSDSAETPRYVETVARRGYRWIAPLDSAAPEQVVSTQAAVRRTLRLWPALAFLLAGADEPSRSPAAPPTSTSRPSRRTEAESSIAPSRMAAASTSFPRWEASRRCSPRAAVVQDSHPMGPGWRSGSDISSAPRWAPVRGSSRFLSCRQAAARRVRCAVAARACQTGGRLVDPAG